MPPQYQKISSHLASPSFDDDELPITGERENNSDSNEKTNVKGIHPTEVIPVLFMIDMFSVALVVPLLNQYYMDAGVSSASLREFLSSLFSSSQILGSLLMGALSDSGILSRKNILYLSFLGSALSYSLIVYGGVKGLIVSRVIVGGVKQTFTISTSIISSHTKPQERSRHMGRLTACSTGAFIIGPSVGGYLYKNVDKRAPALLASILFILNFILAALFLPSEEKGGAQELSSNTRGDKNGNPPNSDVSKLSRFIKNLEFCFASKDLSAVVVSSLMCQWLLRATSYASMASFYEKMYGIETHQRGYLSSYQSMLSLLFQTFFVESSLKLVGGEYRAACFSSGAIATATFLKIGSNLNIFLTVICPMIAVANSLLRLSLNSLVTQIAPEGSVGSVLAAQSVLQNAASVSVPFYRTLLFKLMLDGGGEDVDTNMTGDPSPTTWLKSSVLHWTFACFVMSHLLLGKTRQKKD